ncbi:hypothetical protein [Sphingomonas sp.]|uniref:hypothetical protein n=1 Tax=Sphingomonas sp. TaxID=28214 RepID=UPI0025E414D7|nr:hypothetical protein [Sphingomonas sp.]MBV9526985.1 hypothetical protein [Sphingomonas sp.]
MLLLAATALAATAVSDSQPRQTVAPVVQARATVRVIVGTRVELGQQAAIQGQQLRWSTVSTPEGNRRASLVEFE